MRASQAARPGPSPPPRACTIICTLNDTWATAAEWRGAEQSSSVKFRRDDCRVNT